MQGNFSHGGGGYLDELKSYVVARLLRNDSKPLNELIEEFCINYYGKEGSKYIIDYINLWEQQVKDYDLWLYDDADSLMFNDDVINKSFDLLNKALHLTTIKEQKNRIEKLLLGVEYLYLVRLDLNYPNRDSLIDQFKEKLLKHKITEIFERTSLDYSIDVMKKSQYAKERKDWYSLYYIMR